MKVDKSIQIVGFCRAIAALIFSTLIFVLVSCAGDSGGKKQEPIEFEESIKPQVSELHMPITLDIKDIEDVLNKNLKEIIYADSSFDHPNKDNLKLILFKRKKIKIQSKKKTLEWQAPVEVKAAYRVEKKVFGRYRGVEQDFEFEVLLHFESGYSLNENYNLVTKTALKKIDWIAKPKLDLFFFKIELDRLVEKEIFNARKKIEAALDKAIQKNVDLKKVVQKIWVDMQKPIRINKNHKEVWLITKPIALELQQVYGMANQLLIVPIGVKSLLTAVVGPMPEIKIDSVLPKLLKSKSKDQDFKLELFSEILFADLNQLLKDSVVGKKISTPVYDIYIKEAFLEPADAKNLRLLLNFDGETSGTVSFIGTPIFDTKDNSLKLNNFKIEVNSENYFVKMADWWYNTPEIADSLSKNLVVRLDDQLKQIPALITQSVSQGKMGQKIALQIDKMKVMPQKVLVQKNGIQLLIMSEGEAKLLMKDL